MEGKREHLRGGDEMVVTATAATAVEEKGSASGTATRAVSNAASEQEATMDGQARNDSVETATTVASLDTQSNNVMCCTQNCDLVEKKRVEMEARLKGRASPSRLDQRVSLMEMAAPERTARH